MAVTLYHFAGSLCSQKVRLALAEKGVPWDSKIIDLLKGDNLHPDYMALNPNGVVPTLVHDGLMVTESHRILKYISREFPGPTLEQGNEDLIDAWLDLQDKVPVRLLTYGLMGGLQGWLMRGTVRRRRKRAAKLAAAPSPHQEAYRAKLKDIEAWEAGLKSPDVIDNAMVQLNTALEEIEQTLKRQRWLAGDRYTLADTAWTPFFARLEMLGLSRQWKTRKRREISRYVVRLKRRPSFKTAIKAYEEEQKKYVRRAAFRRLWPWFIMLIIVLAGLGWAFQTEINDFLKI